MSHIAMILLALVVRFADGEDEKAKLRTLPAEAKAILEKAEELELISLDPNSRSAKGFHNQKVLGSTKIKKASVRKQIVRELEKAITTSDGVGARCFIPRHGIRAVAGDKSVDLVICFQCKWVYLYYDKTNKERGTMTLTNVPLPLLNKLLQEAGVPLPPQAD